MRYCVPIVCDMCGSRTVFEKEISNSGAQFIVNNYRVVLHKYNVSLYCSSLRHEASLIRTGRGARGTAKAGKLMMNVAKYRFVFVAVSS